MNQFPPNTNPEVFSIIGVIVGIILEDDYNANELNSIGNWIILVGQVLLTTAAQQQLINARYQNNTGSRIRSHSNDHTINNTVYASQGDLANLYNIVQNLQTQIEQIKKR